MTRQLMSLCTLTVVALVLAAVSFAQDNDESVLRPGDVVRITVYGQSDLNTVTRIAANGTISFPFVGDVRVGGLTTADAERRIAARLGDGGFVRNAQVTVFLEERRPAFMESVTILGQVERSGRYPLMSTSAEGADTLIDLLALAGGVNATAADFLMLLRQTDQGQERVRIDLDALMNSGDITANQELRDEDIVIVPQMEVFYIYGQVHRPGRYRLEKDMTVMQALAVASGVTERGTESGVVLRRRNADAIRTINAKLTDELQANDVIYVKESFF
jgi:polysaccharide biosynthesis/export protein